jgi:hypothetical protein
MKTLFAASISPPEGGGKSSTEGGAILLPVWKVSWVSSCLPGCFSTWRAKKVCRTEFRLGGGRGPYAPVAVCLAAIAIQSFMTAEVPSPNMGAHLTIFSPGLGTCVENSEHQHTMGKSKFYGHHIHVFLNGDGEVGDDCHCLIFFFGFRCL